MQTAVNAINWRRGLRLTGLLIVVLLALWFASRIPHTVAIFVIAAFIAFGAQPLVVRLEKWRIPRPAAIAIVFAGLIVLIAIGFVLILPLTIGQIQSLAANAPTYVSTVQQWMSAGEASIRSRFPSVTIPTTADIATLSSQRLSTLATTTLQSLGTILLGTATAFFIGFSALTLSFFFLAGDRQIGVGFASLFPERRQETARKLATEVTQLFGSYISGQVIVSAITGVVIAIGSALVGFKFALILGIISAIAYAIPMFGMLVAQLIALVLCLPQGPAVIIWVQVIVFVMARISDSVLVPKIMGESVGVSPIGVMFAVFAGGELFGLPGLLLGIPAAALIKILWRYFIGPWLHNQMEADA